MPFKNDVILMICLFTSEKIICIRFVVYKSFVYMQDFSVSSTIYLHKIYTTVVIKLKISKRYVACSYIMKAIRLKKNKKKKQTKEGKQLSILIGLYWLVNELRFN